MNVGHGHADTHTVCTVCFVVHVASCGRWDESQLGTDGYGSLQYAVRATSSTDSLQSLRHSCRNALTHACIPTSHLTPSTIPTPFNPIHSTLLPSPRKVWLRDYLSSMVEHMPPPHRAFLARLAAANRYQPPTAAAAGSNDPLPAVANVRTFVQTYTGAPAVAAAGAAVATAGVGGGLQASAGQGELRDAYNAAVEELERFRSQHKAFANAYIARWAKKETTGTGGSDFMPALAGYRDTTARHFVQ